MLLQNTGSVRALVHTDPINKPVLLIVSRPEPPARSQPEICFCYRLPCRSAIYHCAPESNCVHTGARARSDTPIREERRARSCAACGRNDAEHTQTHTCVCVYLMYGPPKSPRVGGKAVAGPADTAPAPRDGDEYLFLVGNDLMPWRARGEAKARRISTSIFVGPGVEQRVPILLVRLCVCLYGCLAWCDKQRYISRVSVCCGVTRRLIIDDMARNVCLFGVFFPALCREFSLRLSPLCVRQINQCHQIHRLRMQRT